MLMIREWLANLFSKKEMTLEERMSLYLAGGSANWSARNYSAYAIEGFSENAIVYRCVDYRASFIDNLEWVLTNSRGNVITAHPLLSLIKRPNTKPDSNNFFYDLMAYLDIAGNGYIFANRDGDSPPRELLLLRPDRVNPKVDNQGYLTHYEYIGGYLNGTPTNRRIFPVNFVDGSCDLIHWKTFNPMEEFVGMSVISPAAKSTDCFNESLNHIKATLENKGTASGIFTTTQPLHPDSQQSLRSSINEFKVGGKRQGEDMILHSGLTYQRVGATPQELETTQGVIEQARLIAQAFGVPEQLVGIPGSQTYANYAEARLSFTENTMLPIAGNLEQLLNDKLVPMFGKNLILKYDKGKISALEEKRNNTMGMLKDVNYLTINEKRKLVGFDPIEGGDTFQDNPVNLTLGINNGTRPTT